MKATATIQLLIYGDTDAEILQQVLQAVDGMNNYMDCNAQVLSVVVINGLNRREIDATQGE